MAFTTGTAETPTDLMVKLDTFMAANSWVRQQGETDMACASPKAATYWRVVWLYASGSDNVPSLLGVSMRETLGGPNLVPVGSGSSNYFTEFEFAAPTIVREVLVTPDNAASMPDDILVQWSNDGQTWTDMYGEENVTWTSSITETFQFDDGFLFNQHFSSTICRRSGRFSDTEQSSRRNNDVFAWEGPGYDPTRQLYVGMVGLYDQSQNFGALQVMATTDWDGTLTAFEDQENFDGADRKFLVFDANQITYWFYLNDTRLLIVIRSGTDDYTAAYVGFLGAFAQPTEWALPLYVAATNDDGVSLGDASNRNSMPHCPGNDGCAAYLDWNFTWQVVENYADSAQAHLPLELPSQAYVWPWHTGYTNSGAWPANVIGNRNNFTAHWLDKLEPTQQNELPVIPSMIVDKTYGFVGTLDGVFAIPSGGIAVPEQTITVGADTYRLFPARTLRDGNDWFAVLEA